MNREQASKHLDIIKALAEGKTIQYYTKAFNTNGEWRDCPFNEPAFTTDTKYRIKPEPRKVYIWMGSLEKNKRIRHVYDEESHKRLVDNNMKGYWDGCWKIYGPFELED